MTLLETHDSLRLHTKRRHPQVIPKLDEVLPQPKPIAGRHMDLVGKLTSESDPPQETVGDTGHRAGSHLHVPKLIRVEVDFGETADQLT